jgi:hypothetical protein
MGRARRAPGRRMLACSRCACDPDLVPVPVKQRFAWFGTVKGGLALLATIVGITGGIIGIARSCQSDPGTPSFEGSVEPRESARDLVSFLTDHDGELVKLNVTCSAKQPAGKSCNGNVEPSSAGGEAREGERVAIMELFTERACPATGARARCAGTYWMVFRVPSSADAQVDNGGFGAGGLVAKGTFKALDRGPLGGVPLHVHVVELVATA